MSFVKLFTFTLVLVSIGYQAYNMMHSKQLIKKLGEDYGHLYSTIRRFGYFYNNSSSETMEAGVHKHGDISIIVLEKPTKVKNLAPGLDKLNDRLEQFAPEAIWSISILENASNYGLFMPLHPGYEELFSKNKKTKNFERLMTREKLNNTYQEFYGCNTRMTEVYVESITNAQIRTIYFPIHNRESLDAIVAVDIKASFTDTLVDKYNDQNKTVLSLDDASNIFKSEGRLPCTTDKKIEIGSNFTSVLKASLWPSFILSILTHIIYCFVHRHGQFIKKDEMTGLYRRDYYEPKFKRVNKFSLLVIDIDHFKKINDTYGHTKGDEVIKICAQIIMSQIRSEDIAVRWGGEEFIVMFKDMKRNSLFDKAEQIRESIALDDIADLSVTISIGGYTANNISFSEAYKAADGALYQSKHRGRNKVTIA
ncbi:GGDEF domain-containing protein [Grimontia sp. NTOU-MAR1]|uniref:GGDEF domain-containing protein n=1 Tax=Grimontia sp. NTOU-MAR1 TaxID=3111011 RepID=UPI002DB7511E|nr:GGDEF domain-containing protein [Grimontia sp. NTOU-MAR1]WRV98454.1 GGDEF domain-containing protein [Grimontia sp. NTOU-MAR1]